MEDFQAYGEFARVYDMFQDNVDYQLWASWLKGQLKKFGISGGLVLDLGCGTGTMTELLAEAGYDMIGLDNSEEMLAEAMEKRVESGHDILYLMQDMQDFELYGTVRAVVSVCDSLNYITEEEELERVFSLVNNYLDPEGIFLFDMNTIYKYQTMIGGRTVTTRKQESTPMSWLFSFQERTASTRKQRKSITREPIPWRRRKSFWRKQDWNLSQFMMPIQWSRQKRTAADLLLLSESMARR